MGAVRLVIAEPDADLRRELRSYLDSVGGFQVAGEASSPEDALMLVEQLSPDVVLAGFPLETPGDIETATRIRSSITSGGLILLVSPEGTPGEIFSAITVGAAACIPRDTPGEFIASTLLRVAQGEQPIQYTLLSNHEVASRVLNWIRETGQHPYVAVSSPCPLSP
ncbi:MAG: response regulator transcription factor, partial [Chloroflexi bacterium]|nr:response regulator transcription factor [Chloroflexota bacterium]